MLRFSLAASIIDTQDDMNFLATPSHHSSLLVISNDQAVICGPLCLPHPLAPEKTSKTNGAGLLTSSVFSELMPRLNFRSRQVKSIQS
ncbi:hypothetical protein RRG08_023816 [Elysia crispata]|uniref:Uncharacterized protein n=1 Tax=Elysia crispata TaxID=231223 RepID=A0AAE0ZVV2_9GAST|nr:hypothetical protein RRG08_023816 [Elysia crispata]